MQSVCLCVCLCVCLHVCLSTSVSLELIFTKCFVQIPRGRGSVLPWGVALRYVLPVLWVTSRLAVVGRMAMHGFCVVTCSAPGRVARPGRSLMSMNALFCDCNCNFIFFRLCISNSLLILSDSCYFAYNFCVFVIFSCIFLFTCIKSLMSCVG